MYLNTQYLHLLSLSLTLPSLCRWVRHNTYWQWRDYLCRWCWHSCHLQHALWCQCSRVNWVRLRGRPLRPSNSSYFPWCGPCTLSYNYLLFRLFSIIPLIHLIHLICLYHLIHPMHLIYLIYQVSNLSNTT